GTKLTLTPALYAWSRARPRTAKDACFLSLKIFAPFSRPSGPKRQACSVEPVGSSLGSFIAEGRASKRSMERGALHVRRLECPAASRTISAEQRSGIWSVLGYHDRSQ